MNICQFVKCVGNFSAAAENFPYHTAKFTFFLGAGRIFRLMFCAKLVLDGFSDGKSGGRVGNGRGNNKRQTFASVVAWLAEVCLEWSHCPMGTASGDAVYFLGLLWRMRAERMYMRIICMARLVVAAVRDDDVGILLCRFDELIVHRFEDVAIFRDQHFQRMSAFGDVMTQ